QVPFEGRDATISGVTTDPDSIELLIAQVSALHGVRSVTSDIIPAPTASPYPFIARLENGEISLSGGVPSMKIRDEILARSGAKDGGLNLLSGVPDGDWQDAALFAISQLDGLESGEASLADLSLSVSGTAKSPQSYADLDASLMAELPAGISLEGAAIEPAFVEDFTFGASRKGGVTGVSGFIPDEATRERVAELSGADTGALLVAGGAPESFSDALDFGMAVLARMDEGELKISGADLSVSGTAASHEDYAAVAELVGHGAPEGVTLGEVSLVPATQENYFWSIQKLADGSLTIRGYVPDEATRSAILARAGTSVVDQMQIAKGAPATFYEDALVAISALKNLESGRAGFGSDRWFLAGQPASADDAEAATGALITARTIADRWDISIAEPPLVPVVPYSWSARKSADGQIVLKGNVPDELTQTALLRRAGDGAINDMQISYGAPATFYEDALVAISALKELESGRAGHGAKGWYLSGQPLNADAEAAATGALITARTPASDWNVDLAAPLEVEEPVAPTEEVAEETVGEPVAVASTASFAAELAEGNISLSGQVPDRDARNIIGLVSGGVATAGLLESSTGVPEGFLSNARAGIGALRLLAEGRLALEGGQWSLSGKAKDAGTREAALGLVGGLADGANWQTDIALFSPDEVCQSEVSDYSGAVSIEFATGSAQIATGSMPVVQDMADFLNRCSAFSLTVEGHTDNQGDFAANLALSIDRADAVIAALEDMGVAKERMLSVGFGEARPVADNDTAQGRQANRRIVFQIKE
ncbi:MAG TPA: OmpA family protein, partial [Devosia sp.]|nr:OmpA family protein [Devosia sp.]